MINMFYDLRVDFDKLEIAFSLTKLVITGSKGIDENKKGTYYS